VRDTNTISLPSKKEKHMHAASSERLGIPRVPTRLRDEFEGPTPTHTAVYAAAVNGLIPAIWERGRWYIDPADLPQIAVVFGMRPRKMQAA
jgi:hypothetical protein